MCGFLGQISSEKFDKDLFKELLALGNHRGPDKTGYWENERVQFGFNRLSIIDRTEAGDQPMRSPNGKYIILFNGEIYNHLELRKKLSNNHYRGHSDTETVTHALEVWGVYKTIRLLDGMFALSIYEEESGFIYLARDFAGIKPLFYGQKEGSLVFASQYDQVLQHPLFKNSSIDPKVLKLYLQQHFLPAPFGLHQGLHQVRPGEIIRFDKNGNKEFDRFWEMPSKSDYAITDPVEAEKAVKSMLGSCVQDQLIADVPLGAFLSGGVDSPLVCAAAKYYKADLTVFSIGSDSKIHDESERAIAFANAMKLEQKLWKLDGKQILNYWEEAMNALHEPLADFSILPTYLVSKLARKDVTVVLSGDGGDELFFGYERFWSIGKNIKFQHLPKLLRLGLYGINKYTLRSKKINSGLLANKQSETHEKLHNRFHINWLNDVAPDLMNVELPAEWQVYDYPNAKDERELLGYMRKSEFYGMMQKTLRKVDLASMQNSLEVRVPFLQKKMIEASLEIDPMISYGAGRKKQVLKNLLGKEIPEVPDDNVKRGFSIPLSKWIREDLQPVFKERLLSGSMVDLGMEKKVMEKMIKIHVNGEQDLKWPLFTLYALSR